MPLTSGLGTQISGLSNIGLGGLPTATPSPSANPGFFIGVTQVRFLTAKVVRRSTNQLDTVPKFFDMALTETFPYIVDVTNYLGTGDTISSISPVLTLVSTGQTVSGSWFVAPTTLGNVITIPINVNLLQFGQQYQIAVNFTASSSKKATYTSIFNVVS